MVKKQIGLEGWKVAEFIVKSYRNNGKYIKLYEW